jgi:putative PIN family toxin of toxin-antitoxin system
MLKVVLDTNVLIVAVSRRSRHFPIFEALLQGRYELCVTNDILNEYAEKLEEKYRPDGMENFMQFLERSPDVIRVTKYFYWNLIANDPDDDKFVDCAIAANADFIVTDDRDFRVLAKIAFPKVRVISTDDFVEILTGKRPEKRK